MDPPIEPTTSKNWPNHAQDAIEAIDRALEEPVITIQAALNKAVEKGRMTAEEANDCLIAYLRTFEIDDD